MAFWAEHKVACIKRFLKLAGGIPSHDTFNRVFRILDPRTFEDAVRREDAATVRKNNAADNLSPLKRIVLNLLKVETATDSFGKISLAKTRQLAAWDDGYRMAMSGITPAHDG